MVKAKPTTAIGFLVNGEGVSAVIYLNSRQVWEVKENTYDATRVKLERQNVKLNITKEEYEKYFKEVE